MSKTLLLFGGLALSILVLIAIFARIALTPGVKQNLSSVIPKELPQSDSATFPKELPDEPTLTKKEILKLLEASFSAVNKRIDDISQRKPISALSTTESTTTQTTITSGPKTVYIPVGNSGSVSSLTETNITGHEVTIDASNYPGFKQMVLEANFRIFQGQGMASLRLYNKTDGLIILNSEISTTSEDFVTKTSSGFSLLSSSKTYVVQAKSTTAYSVDLQWSRIRVDF